MRTLPALALVLLAGAASAQPVLPSLYDVTRVGPSSVLNVRAGPGTGNPVIGTLAPNATDVEIVAVDPSGGWGQLNLGEGAGWSSLRFLAEQPNVWTPGSLPDPLTCLGTEPFWNVRVTAGGAVFETPETSQSLASVSALDTGIPDDVRRALVLAGGGDRITATIAPEACNDGMSDRAFGLGTLVIVEEGGGAPRLLTGCCSIAP